METDLLGPEEGNATGNWSGLPPPFENSWSLVTALISLTVFLFGFVGNTLAIYVVLRYAKMKTVTNTYILNLAVADQLYILGMPFLTTQNVLSYWPFGDFMCRVVMTTDSINQFTSTFCLMVMSIDRYLAVVHPIRSQRWRRPRVAKAISALVWTLAVLVVLPVVIFSSAHNPHNSCNVNWPEPKHLWDTIFIIYTATLGFLLPLLVICLCYLLIVIKVKSSGARAGLKKRRRSEQKVTRMVVVIVVVFVLCWLPFFILNVVNLVFILPENSLMAGVYFFVVTLTYVNSCANPLLYGFLSENFRQSFQKVLCLHKASRAVANGNVGSPRPAAKNQGTEGFLTRNQPNLNVHAQNVQGVHLEVCENSKRELLSTDQSAAGPQIISQSTIRSSANQQSDLQAIHQSAAGPQIISQSAI
ncbi:somatostatin receptor type 5-like [Clupea harengus]|uniref:Somatostatin receptor type 5-like n=1 Tax=Clupea harengus TaxID=7950 RepID=A0A6P8EWC4_CLUHA|nr:somatostatin receptor type 5-like [Clupea harengus]